MTYHVLDIAHECSCSSHLNPANWNAFAPLSIVSAVCSLFIKNHTHAPTSPPHESAERRRPLQPTWPHSLSVVCVRSGHTLGERRSPGPWGCSGCYGPMRVCALQEKEDSRQAISGAMRTGRGMQSVKRTEAVVGGAGKRKEQHST